MNKEEKKVRMLIKAVIYHYHGLDDLERDDLETSARMWEAQSELEWSMEFVSADYITAFDRAREYLNPIISDYPQEKRSELIHMVWESNNLKGYVTEMEATAMLKLARDWSVEAEFTQLVLS
jgi:hypothetical protein